MAQQQPLLLDPQPTTPAAPMGLTSQLVTGQDLLMDQVPMEAEVMMSMEDTLPTEEPSTALRTASPARMRITALCASTTSLWTQIPKNANPAQSTTVTFAN